MRCLCEPTSIIGSIPLIVILMRVSSFIYRTRLTKGWPMSQKLDRHLIAIWLCIWSVWWSCGSLSDSSSCTHMCTIQLLLLMEDSLCLAQFLGFWGPTLQAWAGSTAWSCCTPPPMMGHDTTTSVTAAPQSPHPISNRRQWWPPLCRHYGSAHALTLQCTPHFPDVDDTYLLGVAVWLVLYMGQLFKGVLRPFGPPQSTGT